MNYLTIVLMLVIMGLLQGCSSRRFKPYVEVAEVCRDPEVRSGCLKTMEGYDNTTLHKHDYREIESIEVPVR